MCSHVRQSQAETGKGEKADFWNGSHFNDFLRGELGLFQDDFQRDLALMLTTDELTPYKKKAYYRVRTSF